MVLLCHLRNCERETAAASSESPIKPPPSRSFSDDTLLLSRELEPLVVLVPAGDNRALVFEHAQALKRGERVKLTLTSAGAGKAILYRAERMDARVGAVASQHPLEANLEKNAGYVAVGNPHGSQPLEATLEKNTGCISVWSPRGSHRLLGFSEGTMILTSEDDGQTRKAGRSFEVNDDGTISPARARNLVLGEGYEYEYDATMDGDPSLRPDLLFGIGCAPRQTSRKRWQTMARWNFRRQLEEVEDGQRNIDEVTASCFFSPE